MLYWSSLLREEETKELKVEVLALKRQLSRLQLQPSPLYRSRELAVHNLLKTDPFYEETLPQLLGPEFEPHGVLRVAEIGKPENLHPFSPWHNVGELLSMCTLPVACTKFGFYEEISPGMALAIERRDDEFWVFLRDQVYWEPLKEQFFPAGFQLDESFLEPHQVTAEDFKFYFDAVMNPYVQLAGALGVRNVFADIEEFRIIDPLTFVVRWRKSEGKIKYTALQATSSLKPLASWVWQRFPDGSKIIEDDDYRNNSVWAQNFIDHWAKNVIVSCGPWTFGGWRDRQITLERNPHYQGPGGALFESYTVEFRAVPDLIWQDFKGEKIEFFDSRFAPDKLSELQEFIKTPLYQEQTPIHQLDSLDRAFRYIGWSCKSPFFKNKKVRQAMTMAIDRQRVIDSYLNGMGVITTGPLSPADVGYDKSIEPWSYDPVAARRLLEEEGWVDRDGDGIREKQGVPFSFTMIYFVGNAISKLLSDYLTTALREIGVECKSVGLDVADLSARIETKDFDAVILAWTIGSPPPNYKQIWHSSGAEQKGSSNLTAYVNPEVDELIELLEYEENLEQRKRYYHRFHQIMHEDQPYTFLFVPKRTLVYRENLGNLFIPSDRPDLIPAAVVTEPSTSIVYKIDG
ncbi:MAG: permease [Verrucomicrobia bacterium]|nr:permease [Verrucomicrobiota bacterium]